MASNHERHPLSEALALLARWPAPVAAALLFAQYFGQRVAQTWLLSSDAAPALTTVAFVIGPLVLNLVVGTAVFFLLARTLLADLAGPPFVLRAIGLVVLYNLALNAATFIVTTMLIVSGSSSEALGLAIIAAGALAAIALFPLVVRTFSLAAGIGAPRIGEVWSRAFGDQWAAFVSYAFVVLAGGGLVYGSLVLLGGGVSTAADAIEAAIDAVGHVLRGAVAIVAVRLMAPATGWESEVFE